MGVHRTVLCVSYMGLWDRTGLGPMGVHRTVLCVSYMGLWDRTGLSM